MRILDLAQMNRESINLLNITVISVHEPAGKVGIYSATRRKTGVLCYCVRGHRRYYPEGGRPPFDLMRGDILYIPQETAYRFEILDTESEALDHMIAIHFRLADEAGETVNFGSRPRVLLRDKLDHYFSLFRRIEDAGASGQGSGLLRKAFTYALLHEIVSQLDAEQNCGQPCDLILPAVFFIEEDPSRDVPIPVLAEMCAMSQTRFRALFREYTKGLSPVEYRNQLRIERVEQLLFTGEFTVQRAAVEAGFRDISHFYRIWRKYKGEMPSDYRA